MLLDLSDLKAECLSNLSFGNFCVVLFFIFFFIKAVRG